MDDARWEDGIIDEIRIFRMKGYSWRPTRRLIGARDAKVPVDYWSIAMTLPSRSTAPDIVLGLAGPTPRVRGREWELVNLMRRSIRLNLGG